MGKGVGEGGGEGRGAEGTGGKQKGEKPDTRFLLGTEEGRSRGAPKPLVLFGVGVVVVRSVRRRRRAAKFLAISSLRVRFAVPPPTPLVNDPDC